METINDNWRAEGWDLMLADSAGKAEEWTYAIKLPHAASRAAKNSDGTKREVIRITFGTKMREFPNLTAAFTLIHVPHEMREEFAERLRESKREILDLEGAIYSFKVITK